jgi:hypothetical protein
MFLRAPKRSDHAPVFVCDESRGCEGESPGGLSDRVFEGIVPILVSLPGGDTLVTGGTYVVLVNQGAGGKELF